MSLNYGIYNPDDVNVIVNNVTIEGFAEDELVRTERLDENEFTTKVGAKGDYTFVKNLNRAGSIILTLKQASPSNIKLQALKYSSALFSVTITSKHNYSELASGVNCMVGIAPRKKFGKDEDVREWNLITGDLVETDKAL